MYECLRMQKLPYLVEEHDACVAGWLHLAAAHLGAGKLDAADSLCTRALAVHTGCARAHELRGRVAERAERSSDAAAAYAKAWELGGKSDPAAGYRLAWTHLQVCDCLATVSAVCWAVMLHVMFAAHRRA